MRKITRILKNFPTNEIINIPLLYFLLFIGVLALKSLGGIGIFISFISFMLMILPIFKSNLLKKSFLVIIIGFLLATFLGLSIYLLIQLLLTINIFTVKISGSKELFIAVISLLTAVLTFTAGKIFEHGLDQKQKISNEIKPTYKKFNSFLIALREGNLSRQERENFIIEIDEGIFSWGYYKVTIHWDQVKYDLLVKELSDKTWHPKLEKLWLALRKQTGLPDETENQLSSFVDWKVKNH